MVKHANSYSISKVLSSATENQEIMLERPDLHRLKSQGVDKVTVTMLDEGVAVEADNDAAIAIDDTTFFMGSELPDSVPKQDLSMIQAP